MARFCRGLPYWQGASKDELRRLDRSRQNSALVGVRLLGSAPQSAQWLGVTICKRDNASSNLAPLSDLQPPFGEAASFQTPNIELVNFVFTMVGRSILKYPMIESPIKQWTDSQTPISMSKLEKTAKPPLSRRTFPNYPRYRLLQVRYGVIRIVR
jgi:hypothetical protein